ncbi:DNA polymerase ligase N-terminal domain-containing protein [Umezawaea sp. Da 62-37]|uniref:DNA polymerase ligase N-terminal domain-containing protein n=1 Tax=Umezawaea sp. Da 62-37 TaxID=3075927 RepID=UPI0028F6FBA9|nr:DNA polymerase ligase N-terminal domain-containing protein [Umezawaea sp. Da 62-37]WNV86639.1 DNA polymerase ligase N-terminal domain-containing protein [Umezawaea sp. Da 62-37]WNV86778.1 DNA polymerase ligase N-terminal domain-containing protein [Umezawaea sp. Da 62-37]
MADLSEYRRKRDPQRTPEPVPDPTGTDPGVADAGVLPRGRDDTFVIQEHHASSLHWDVRLERGGVLVSWAVPKGLPPEPGTIRLAVHTEDHPLEYAAFTGTIPRGEYGGGEMFLWDRGRYDTVKWDDHEVHVVLHGERVRGEFVFFRRDRTPGTGSGGKDWMVRRRHAAVRPDWIPLPQGLTPMLPTTGPLPSQEAGWSYEFAWDGVRVLARVEGGRVTLTTGAGRDVTATYPELQGVGARLGMTQAVLDGVVVAFAGGRPNAEALERRVGVVSAGRARRLVGTSPVTLLVVDVLHLEGHSMLGLPYTRRRGLVEGLGLTGRHWSTPPSFPDDGDAVATTARGQGIPGVLAKRSDSPYSPGTRSPDWILAPAEPEPSTGEDVGGSTGAGDGEDAGAGGSAVSDGGTGVGAGSDLDADAGE